jgi:hypothetical protein
MLHTPSIELISIIIIGTEYLNYDTYVWRLLGRPRRRWVDSIKMDLREIGWVGMDWIDLAKDREVLE